MSGGQAGIEKAFKKLGLEQRPYVIIYDQTSKNERLLEADIADFLIDQNGFEQGYRPLKILSDILLNVDALAVSPIDSYYIPAYMEEIETREIPTVTFDTGYPFEENIDRTVRVVELAGQYGATVEAELGLVGGSEDGSTDHGIRCTNLQTFLWYSMRKRYHRYGFQEGNFSWNRKSKYCNSKFQPSDK